MRKSLAALAVFSLLLLTGIADDDGRLAPGVNVPRGARLDRLALAAADIGQSWPQFGAAPETSRAALSQFDVPRLRATWQIRLPEVADGAPVYVNNATLASGGQRDLVIVTTKVGRVVALDARSGRVMWETTPPPGPRWTTSSPAVDPNGLYVYSYALDGFIHRYRLADGSEVAGGGWPQLVTLKPAVEKGSSPITIGRTRDGGAYLYMTTAAYPEPGDDGDYQGHLVTVNLATGEQKVFNAGCSDRAIHFVENGDATNDCGLTQGGIWGRAGAVYDSVTDRVFVTIGNGEYDADRGGYNWGSSIVALRPDGSTDGGTPLDSYTPADYPRLNALDLDLSSASVALLPSSVGRTFGRLAVQGGKDSLLRLVDLSNLSGQGGPRHLGGELEAVAIPQGGHIVAHPATWLQPSTRSAWVFVANFRGIAAFSVGVDGPRPELTLRWWRAEAASSPVVVNNVLYYAGASGMQACDPATGRVLWHDTQIANVHWQSPIVVNGVVYIADEAGWMTAYAVVPGR